MELTKTDYGYSEGDTCNRNGCLGIISDHEVENCSCHISPPCSQCTSPRSFCEVCGWEDKDEQHFTALRNKHDRAVLGIDGDYAFALLGCDLQEGESEFVKIEYDPTRSYVHEVIACKVALGKLRERLGMPDLNFVFGRSHPYGN